MESIIRNLNYKWNNNRWGEFRKKGWYTREHWNNYAELVNGEKGVLQSIKRGVYAWCDFDHLSPTMKFVANLPIICQVIRFKIPKEYICMYVCMYHFWILLGNHVTRHFLWTWKEERGRIRSNNNNGNDWGDTDRDEGDEIEIEKINLVKICGSFQPCSTRFLSLFAREKFFIRCLT